MTSATLDREGLIAAPYDPGRRSDTVITLLSFYALLLIIIPSDEVFSPLGGAGAPSTLLGASFLVIYLSMLFNPAAWIAPGRLGLRLAAILLLCAFLAAYVAGNLHMMNTTAQNGADRGLIILAGWLGIFLLTADGIGSIKRLMKLLDRIVLGATLMAIIGEIQFATGKNLAAHIKIPGLVIHQAYSDLETRGTYNRPQATAAHPLEFAFILATVLPIAIHFARHAPRDRRLMRWAQVAVIGLALPLTISRSAIISMAVVAVVMIPVWSRRERVFAVMIAAVVFLTVLLAIPGLLSEFATLFQRIGTDSSTASRTSAYSGAVQLIMQHPFFGTGFETFDPQTSFYTDNEYLNGAIEVGLIGVIVLAALFITGWATARRARRESADPAVRHLGQCLAASCAVIFYDSSTFDSMHYAIASGLTFLILGCVGSLRQLVPAGDSAAPAGFDFRAGTAIVTGAASGIGEQLAHALARRGSALALVDRDAARLEHVADTVRHAYGVPVRGYVTDLADDAATHALGRQLAAAHPDATLLVNNAGVALGGTFEQVTEEEFDWLMAINFRAVVTLTRSLLPVLRAHPGAHLVNVSSLFGLIAPARLVAYATSKFAVRGFTEALRAELDGCVGVTVVHPGGIAIEETADQTAVAKLLTYPPDKAAAEIIDAIERRRPRLLIAQSARVPDLLARIAPGRYPALLAAFERLKRLRLTSQAAGWAST